MDHSLLVHWTPQTDKNGMTGLWQPRRPPWERETETLVDAWWMWSVLVVVFGDQRARLHNYHKSLVSAANHRFSLTEDKGNKFSLNPLMSTDNELILDIDWEKRDQVCQAQDNWPTTFIDALLQWVILLRWPHGEPVCPENDIPWCELYIDFFCTRTYSSSNTHSWD